jgi:hypothetical protein
VQAWLLHRHRSAPTVPAIMPVGGSARAALLSASFAFCIGNGAVDGWITSAAFVRAHDKAPAARE